MIASLGAWLADRVIARALRTPYHHLAGYMGRWWLFRIGKCLDENGRQDFRWLGARVHHILRSDNDRHAHDHPSWYLTIILKGGYWEEREFAFATKADRDVAFYATMERSPCRAWCKKLPNDWRLYTKRWHGPGSVLFRRATDRHRLMLPEGKTAWTLFFMGPRSRVWGYHTEDGFIPSRAYDAYRGGRAP